MYSTDNDLPVLAFMPSVEVGQWPLKWSAHFARTELKNFGAWTIYTGWTLNQSLCVFRLELEVNYGGFLLLFFW